MLPRGVGSSCPHLAERSKLPPGRQRVRSVPDCPIVHRPPRRQEKIPAEASRNKGRSRAAEQRPASWNSQATQELFPAADRARTIADEESAASPRKTRKTRKNSLRALISAQGARHPSALQHSALEHIVNQDVGSMAPANLFLDSAEIKRLQRRDSRERRQSVRTHAVRKVRG
jgi:hypothetical protein